MIRLLFIAQRGPYPPNKGERLRALEQIKALAGHFRVTVASFAHDRRDYESADALRQWAEDVILAPAGGWRGTMRGAACLLRGRSAGEGVFYAKNLLAAIKGAINREPFGLVVASSSTTLPVALAVPAAARVMDLVDVDSDKWLRYAETSRLPMRWIYRREAAGIRRLERMAIERCDAVVVISSAEAAVLEGPSDKVVVVGNGVDTEYFTPQPRPAGGASIVFTGTMSYRPNAEGVCWFVREVWPDLKRSRGDLRFLIVGRDPTRAVRRLAENQGVAVTGSVPDVRPYLASADLAVAPLHIARGVQNKILEAMAAGRAVVASPQALEGLELAEGSDVLGASTPREWKETILSLLSDEAQRRGIEQAARRRVEQDYAWSARLAPLVAMCGRLVGGESGQSPKTASSPKQAATEKC